MANKPQPGPKFDLAHARQENMRRIQRLKKGKAKAKLLSDKLTRCRKERRCRSPACFVCGYLFRKRTLKQALSVFDHEDNIHLVTVVAARSACNRKGLRQLSIRTFKKTLGKHFERAGLSGAIAIGSVEVAYRPRQDRFLLHAHLLVAGPDKAELENLRRYYPTVDSYDRGLVIQEASEGTIKKLMSYTFKFTTYMKVGKNRTPVPTKAGDERALLRFLDRHVLRQFMMTKGVDYVGDEFRRRRWRAYNVKPPSTRKRRKLHKRRRENDDN